MAARRVIRWCAIGVLGRAVVSVSAQPWDYTFTVVTTREVAASSAETAAAFGIPAVSRTETVVGFTLTPVGENAFRITFVTARQTTEAGGAAVPDVERVASLLPGRWLEIAPRAMAAGGVRRSPEFVRDSEEVNYNLLAIMLFPPGGPKVSVWGNGVVAAVARSFGVNVVSFEKAEAVRLPPFEGASTSALEFQVNLEQQLTQNTGVSKMTGSAAMEGAGEALTAADGLVTCARLSLAGEMDRSFIIFGGQQRISEHITQTLTLVRKGCEAPTAWGAPSAP